MASSPEPNAPHPAPDHPAIVEFAFGDLANHPLRVGKPLNRALTGLFGARRGPYRLLYRMDDETLWVYIVHCGAPRDVSLPR